MFLQFCVFMGLVLGLVYRQVSVKTWSVTIGVTLLVFSLASQLPVSFLVLSWVIYLGAVIFVYARAQRLDYFTKPLMQKLQQRMPSISNTEREAIEAGNVWFEKELFCGNPDWQTFLAFPKPTLTPEEMSFLDHQVETLCGMINDWEIVNTHKDLPPSVWDYLKKERFFGLVIPKEYGGHGFSALAHSTIVMKIATRSMSAAINTMVPNSLGPAELLMHYGTDAQKNHYLPRLAKGEDIPCFALTGPEAGSDAGSITDSGIICYGDFQGQKTLGIRLSWDKRYITLAPVATVLGIAFRLFDPDHLMGSKKDLGITLCLVPTSHPGVEMGNRHLPLHLAFMNGPTRGKDVFIPLDWIIGGQAMAGQGWRMLMECLSIGRSISLPALSTACGKLSYRMTGAYAKLRRQFNTSIANFEGVEEYLGNIAGYTYLLECCRLLTANAVDHGIKPAVASAIAKYNMTEMARKVIAQSMDVHAGHAIQAGPRNYLAHAHLAIPISITVEGANILTRNLIIFGQGAIRCHPFVLSEVETLALPDSKEKTEQFDKLLLSHMSYFLSLFVKNLWNGVTGGFFLQSPVRNAAAPLYRQVTRMSIALAFLSDVTMMMLGGSLKRKERISARLGDILSQLYLASSVLKYFNDEHSPESDIDYVKYTVKLCLHDIQNAIDDLLNNFPNRFLGKLLRVVIFPWGRAYQKPEDTLCHAVVKKMLEPSEFRDRLTQHLFLSEQTKDPMQTSEKAFASVKLAEPILKKFQQICQHEKFEKWLSTEEKLQKAYQLQRLSEEEFKLLQEYLILQKEVIKVNEFNFDLSTIEA